MRKLWTRLCKAMSHSEVQCSVEYRAEEKSGHKAVADSGQNYVELWKRTAEYSRTLRETLNKRM